MEEKKKLKVMTRRAQNNKHKTIKEKNGPILRLPSGSGERKK